MNEEKLVISPSGIRGVFGKGLTLPVVRKYTIAFGKWLKNFGNLVIIGRDTRNSGEEIESEVISALQSCGCQVINTGVCPTPITIYTKNKLGIPGGVIISGSHNPEEWNALKFISQKTFLSKEELAEIKKIRDSIIVSNKVDVNQDKVKNIHPIDDYLNDLLEFIDYESIRELNKLKVVVDSGAGTASLIIPQLLESLGCEVVEINKEKVPNGEFPRNPEPVESNLGSLIEKIKEEDFDIGFGYDCDADRLSIVGENGKCYQEDIGLALIADFTFRELSSRQAKGIFVTNNASSLMFDAIVSKFNGSIIRTPIGERYLAERMLLLTKKKESLKLDSEKSETYVFGGEGSCGGVMFPNFNNARDGIFATAKIIEIMSKLGLKISELIAQLPKFYSKRSLVSIRGIKYEKVRDLLRNHFTSKGNVFSELDQDIKIAKSNDWFVLIHPSNTEPIIRVISEAKSENLAINLLQEISQIVQKISTSI